MADLRDSVGSNKDGFTSKPLLFFCLLLSILATVLLLFPAPIRPAHAAPATSVAVDSLADTTGTGVCTLRDAINTVNTNTGTGSCIAGSSTITFSVTGTINLTSDLPHLSKSMTIQGIFPLVTIEGAGLYRAFTVDSGIAVTLRYLVILHTSGSDGPALTNNGSTVELYGTDIYYSNATNSGGAITSTGTLSITNSNLNVNSAAGGNGGALSVTSGSVTIFNSFFQSNTATGSGGAIHMASGAITSTYGVFADNHATGNGGVLYLQSGSMNIITNTLAQNGAGTLAVGGGIYINSGNANISGSTLSSNTSGSGGGIYVDSGTVANISTTTFYSNSAQGGGGIVNYGVLTLTNSTLFANFLTATAGGGGIHNSGTAAVINTTIAGNRGAFTTAGIQNVSGTIVLTNTIIADNSPGINCFNLPGTFTDGGNNVAWPSSDTSCPGTIPFGDPKLGPFVNTGGFIHPILTRGLLSGSAAINAGNDTVCAAPPVNNLDQRGVSRPIGAHCDIGATEGTTWPLFLPLIMR